MIEFKLPALGADMDEGTLLEWKIKPGDTVSKGQVVAIVDTAKAAVDLECWQEGEVLELIAETGQKMPVGTVMATLREPGEEAVQAGQPGGPELPPPTASTARRRVSPAARKHAPELGVDLDVLAGTGPGGAVTLDDVMHAAAARPAAKLASKPADISPASERAGEIRRAIAAAMARSKREIPHYYVAEEIALAKALAWLQEQNASRPMAERLLPAVLLLKAVALALRRYPELNGYCRDGVFAPADRIHLGVAISLRQGGLIAPALLDADRQPLTQLMQQLSDLVQRTRAGSLKSSELSEATITVTNLGDQGSQSVFGVIYPPQVALVGFGRVTEQPRVDAAGGIKVLPVATASLAADHRVSDGHRGALFLRELADLLQRPEELER